MNLFDPAPIIGAVSLIHTSPLKFPDAIDDADPLRRTLFAAPKLSRLNVVGWSMGGMIAQQLAGTHARRRGRKRRRPELARRIDAFVR